jgi:hypothetical protein
VTTSMGAETNKIFFEFLEATKVADQLLADLRIHQVTNGSSYVLRRNLLMPGPPPYFAVSGQRLQRKEKEKDKLAVLNASGALAAAEAEKRKADAAKEAEDARHAQELQLKHKHLLESTVSEFVTAMDEAELELRVLNQSIQQFDLESTTNIQLIEASMLQSEEALERCTLRCVETEAKQIATTKLIQKAAQASTQLQQEVTRLRNVRPAPEDAAAAADMDRGDEHYATTAFFHAGAMRFAGNLMDMRRAHMDLITSRINVIRLEEHLYGRPVSSPTRAAQPKQPVS